MTEHPLVVAIDDLIERLDRCISYCQELDLHDATERSHPYLGGYMLTHDEMHQIDNAVRKLCQKIRHEEPHQYEWSNHQDQIAQYYSNNGHRPRTSMEAWANSKLQLRKTKAFIRILLAEQMHENEIEAAKTPTYKREVIMGHVIQGNTGQLIVDSNVNKTVLDNTINSAETRFGNDISDFIKSVSEVANKSGKKDAIELVDQFNEELSRAEPRKSLLKITWDNIVSILPAVKEVAGATGALAKIFT